MTGRGAWNVEGLGGTRSYPNHDRPGPYYGQTSGYPPSAVDVRTSNEWAVHYAVRAYQQAINERTGADILVDGYYGPVTRRAVAAFQESQGVQAWGGIGEDTSERLLTPRVTLTVQHRPNRHAGVTVTIIKGLIRKESNWDAGAVGYADDRDVGLVQINHTAHPDWDTARRINVVTCVEFAVDYLTQSRHELGNIRDAIASYNLGRGGARSWVKAGRPNWYNPTTRLAAAPGEKGARDVRGYIDDVLAG